MRGVHSLLTSSTDLLSFGLQMEAVAGSKQSTFVRIECRRVLLPLLLMQPAYDYSALSSLPPDTLPVLVAFWKKA